MSYSEEFRSGWSTGYAKGSKFVDELEAQIANLVIDKGALKDRLRETEGVLFWLSTGNGIPPDFGVEYDHDTCRCRVYRRERHSDSARIQKIFREIPCAPEFVFTKAELLQAIENIQKAEVT